MDINLPGMSGFDALKILREDPATSRIPVVAISANAMPSDVDAGMDAGFFAYLAKPIKIKDLFMESLDVALRIRPGHHPAVLARSLKTHPRNAFSQTLLQDFPAGIARQ